MINLVALFVFAKTMLWEYPKVESGINMATTAIIVDEIPKKLMPYSFIIIGVHPKVMSWDSRDPFAKWDTFFVTSCLTRLTIL